MSWPQKVEIHFVTGKGGVGKSVVAAALACRRAREGKKTLLVELGNQSFYKDFLGLNQIGYAPTPWRENLSVAIWKGADCLREYALHLLKIQSLYQLFFENPVSRALIQVAPGLQELAILGKLTSGPPRFVGPAFDFEVIVVDAYSTGHFLALLSAPHGMSQAIRFGPMGEQSRGIDKVIRDPNVCKYYIVTLPEELPVIETLELEKKLRDDFGITATRILNKILPDEKASGSAGFDTYIQNSKSLKQWSVEKLGASNLQEVPFIFENEPQKLLAEIEKEVR